MRPLHIILLLLVTLVWGANLVVAKIGMREFPPIFFVAIRFFLVAAVLVPFVSVPRGRMAAVWALAVTLGVVHFCLMFVGVKYTDASVAAIAIQSQIPFAALLAAAFLGERLGWRRVCGMLIALGGVMAIVGEPRQGSQGWAVGLIIGAALMWAVANIQVKFLSDLDGSQLNAWMALMAAPMLTAVSLAVESDQWASLTTAGWQSWGAVAFQAFAVVILGYGIWYRMLARYTVNQVMPFTLLVPLWAVLFGIVMLGEPLTFGLIAGGAATLAGVAIIIVRRPATIARRTADT